MLILFVKSNLKKILNFVLILSLLVWAVTVSAKLLSSEVEVLIIKTNERGTEVLTHDNVEERTKQDILNLVNMFVLTHYSYNQLNFDDQKKRSLELFSEQLFEVELRKAIAHKKEIKGRTFSQEAIIQKVDRLGETTVEVEVSKTIFENSKTHNVLSTIILEIKPIKRFKENPYGYEIVKILEKKRY